jgi:hypothetical protein
MGHIRMPEPSEDQSLSYKTECQTVRPVVIAGKLQTVRDVATKGKRQTVRAVAIKRKSQIV